MPLSRRGLFGRSVQIWGSVTASSLLGGPAHASGHAVMLLECQVAGTSYANLPAGIEEHLPVGQSLACRRERDNPKDPLAILVLDASGRKLGYIPRARNEALARLMDAGVPATAEITSCQRINTWLKIDVRVSVRLS
ncbi:MAG: HIRAN domain-containing protein [Actinomycetota bacterium]